MSTGYPLVYRMRRRGRITHLAFGGLVVAAGVPLICLVFRSRVVVTEELGHAYGVLSVVNTAADRATPATFEAEVLEKKSEGRGRSRLVVTPWGPRAEPDEVYVSLEYFNGKSKGDRLCVRLWPGALSVPWYRVGECRED